MKAVPISTLRPGDQFSLAGMRYRTGEVLSLGPGSAVVRYDGYKDQTFTTLMGEEVSFDKPNGPVTISLGTEVIRL